MGHALRTTDDDAQGGPSRKGWPAWPGGGGKIPTWAWLLPPPRAWLASRSSDVAGRWGFPSGRAADGQVASLPLPPHTAPRTVLATFETGFQKLAWGPSS